MDAWVGEQFRVSSSAEEFLRPSCPMIVPRYRQLTYKYSSRSHTLFTELHLSFPTMLVYKILRVE